MRLPPRMRDWGPPTALDYVFENEQRGAERLMYRDLSIWCMQPIRLPYRLPTYKLRERAMYGGKKGRAAVRRLKARGCRPKVERFVLVLR